MGVEPKTLHRGEQAWELVVEKLVRAGPNYYKSRRQCVRGRDDILQTLDRLNQPALLEDVKRAMDGPAKSYQVAEGRLKPVERERTERERKPVSGNDDETRRLARRCAQLESRVEALEAALRTSKVKKRRSRPSTPQAEARARSEASGTRESRSDSPTPSADASSRPQQRDEDPREPGVRRGDAATPEASTSEAPAPRLTFPERAALATAYADLVGDEMIMSEVPAFDLNEGTFYMTDLLDESDEVVGAFVLDLRATVFQAGALTMLDEEARQAMFDTGEPTADILDAMGELVGAQSRCFNAVPGNPHIHINTLRRLDAEKDAWVFNPVQSMGLRDPFDGRVLLVSR